MKLYRTELFGLLSNIKTGLFLEPNDRLIGLLRIESQKGVSELYARLAEL
ncbi:MAG: hypothetical protein KBT68_06005 [bacterium]|nr:hypothetical protein [Candidatus Colisoma equi]